MPKLSPNAALCKQLLTSKDDELTRSLAKQLAQSGDDGLAVVLDAVANAKKNHKRNLCIALVEFGPRARSAVPILCPWFENAVREKRYNELLFALLLLGFSREMLVAALNHPSLDVLSGMNVLLGIAAETALYPRQNPRHEWVEKSGFQPEEFLLTAVSIEDKALYFRLLEHLSLSHSMLLLFSWMLQKPSILAADATFKEEAVRAFEKYALDGRESVSATAFRWIVQLSGKSEVFLRSLLADKQERWRALHLLEQELRAAHAMTELRPALNTLMDSVFPLLLPLTRSGDQLLRGSTLGLFWNWLRLDPILSKQQLSDLLLVIEEALPEHKEGWWGVVTQLVQVLGARAKPLRNALEKLATHKTRRVQESAVWMLQQVDRAE